VITSRRIKGKGQVTFMRDTRGAYKIILENLKGRDHLGDKL
jgi:hypothetical protein